MATKTPFCIDFTNSSDGSVKISTKTLNRFEYSFDNLDYDLTAKPGQTIFVPAGSKLYIRGIKSIDNLFFHDTDENNAWRIKGSNVRLSGNIQDLLNNYNSNLKGIGNFACLFYNNPSIVSARQLLLPAKSVATGSYYGMFGNCRNLVYAPKLPATKLANNCYARMFYNCRSLTTAPKLPALELANNCYYGMFENCTSLTRVSRILPAKRVMSSSYNSMFYNCKSLTTAPKLPATRIGFYGYRQMFHGCDSMTGLPDMPKIVRAELESSETITRMRMSDVKNYKKLFGSLPNYDDYEDEEED